MRKVIKIGFIGVFCAVIGLAFPIFNIFSKQLSMDSHENRLMTGLPQVLHSPLRELPRNLDNFLVDNSPFRYQFVLVNAGLDYALFGTSQSDQVLPGKDGWLFYKDGPNAAQPMANYQAAGCRRSRQGVAYWLSHNRRSPDTGSPVSGIQKFCRPVPAPSLVCQNSACSAFRSDSSECRSWNLPVLSGLLSHRPTGH